MSKPVVSIASGERPASSAKQNQIVKDYVTPGLPILTLEALWFMDNTNPTLAGWTNKVLGWYPFNANKSVYNRAKVLFGFTEGGGANLSDLEISLDSGGTWSDALAGAVAPPVDLNHTNEFYATHDISVISGSQWIGFRTTGTFDANSESFVSWVLGVFLYNVDSAYDPF